ncbi:enoyl-CoA hydratase-related protein [Sneathiella marina]|uniref:Enoyl-CoA hydratase-related protein n=1 Tax=Sneathiella marina TaxID=2950108 RepID=A0ABY4W9Q8_9PROT|nr:enoyl-CoA hydratase-related protein [Sneathiella marina]USG62014.1 enoyl-CoA hydratase-related protein [Sneathiella marina]
MSVRFTVEDNIARVTLDRPDRMNAVDDATDRELEKIWSTIETDDTIRCVILTGAGDRAFSAGADMKSSDGKSGLEYWASQNKNGFGGIAMRPNLTVPIIARVNGLALGGGMEMVLGCDIVIATDDARFGLPEAKVGRLPLAGGMILLQRLVPQKVAASLMMTGRMMSSAEAQSYGLVNSVVSREELDEEVNKWVEDILSCAPLSVRAIKEAIQETSHLSVKEAKSLKLSALVSALVSEDSEEGVTAFREKRAPVWRGR